MLVMCNPHDSCSEFLEVFILPDPEWVGGILQDVLLIQDLSVLSLASQLLIVLDSVTIVTATR